MPSPTYKSIYSAGGISAWAPTDGNCDHLLVWQGAVPTTLTPPTLEDVVAKWNSATVSAGVTNRSIYFCQTFDLSTIAQSLTTFFTTPAAAQAWNAFAYWREPTFAGGSGILFPTGDASPISIGDAELNIIGPAPSGLDDFDITIDPGNAAQLLLTLKTSSPFKWTIYGSAGNNSSLLLPLRPLTGYVAGALSLSMKILSGPDASHPIRKIAFLYQAAPTQMPGEGDGPAFCRFWTGALVDDVDDGTMCNVHLDPRDATNYYAWLGSLELNSRVEPLAGTLHTTLYSPTGDRFKVLAMPNATARLGVVQELMDASGIVSPGQSVLFHPEGQFAIVKPALTASTLNLSSQDLLAGSATTEFFDLSSTTHIRFDKRQPAFFEQDVTGAPVAPLLSSSKNGLVFTSHLSFINANVDPTESVQPDYHTQPDAAPLFEKPAASPVPGHLGRRRKNFGTALITMPVLPFAGMIPDPTPSGKEIRNFDSTHLGAYRRTNSRLPITVTPSHAPATLLPSATSATTLAITPQGLLAEVDDQHNYHTLYFGNPDFANADSGAATEDFSITLTDPGTTDGTLLYQQLQYALAGNQLFMVFRNPGTISFPVIRASATLQTHGFTFSINGELNPAASIVQPPPPVSTAVLLVKFFKGKSLSDLVGDTTLWVCQSHLAPNGNGLDASGAKPTWDGLDTTPDPELQALKAIWTDKTWQGVLALNFPITMPDLLEALRPGLSAPPNGPPLLRAHHAGINAVPVRQSDLPAATAAPPTPAATKPPSRPSSVFGLIRYTFDPATPGAVPPQVPDVSSDPGGSSAHPPKYTFVVRLLDVAIQNSQISRFQAQVDVGFDHLLLDGGQAQNGQPLALTGTYESRPQANGTSKDIFSLSSDNTFSFEFSNSYIQEVTISHAQLTVEPVVAGSPLSAVISFDASLVMGDLSGVIPFPFFKVNSITLSSFGFGFKYQAFGQAAKPDFQFFFQAGSISADIDFTPPTDGVASLLSILPVKLKGMQISLGFPIDMVKGLQYTQINFAGHGVSTFQFGFLMEMDFGSLGQLAGSLSSLRLPMLLGWSPGKGGICFGIQFPTFSGGIDIGVQQFIRLQAEKVFLGQCKDATGAVTAIAIQLAKAQVVMFGKQFPNGDFDIILFIPVSSGRKLSWAFGFKSDPWYLGGGYRILIPGLNTDGATTKTVIAAYQAQLSGLNGSNPCAILPALVASDVEYWSVIVNYSGEAAFNIGIAVADPGVYGVNLAISDFDLDLLYHRVNDQLGIFSIELALPLAVRTMQFGAATVRLPVFRMELHTDGGYLVDFGFPWNNDFSRSAQVEVYIFLGSGGFYYGVTAASAVQQLDFEGGYGCSALSTTTIENQIRTVRVGYASRGGIGRSFTIGILNAEASLTLFGSLEGASAYESATGTSLFHPLLYAISGTMGLMLDISASVDFGIIQASAHILAYAELGITLRRVLAKDNSNNQLVLLTLPVVVYTEVALSVGVDVSIHIGCVDITIHLHFSAVWRLQFTFGGLVKEAAPASLADGAQHALAPEMDLVPMASTPPPTWDPAWRYWSAARQLNLQATVIPCMASGSDLGAASDSYQTAVVGTQMLPVVDATSGFSDLAQCLAGWVLLSGDPANYGTTLISLRTLIALQNQLSPGPDPVTPDPANPAADPPDSKVIWSGFPGALLQLVAAQFAPNIEPVPKNALGNNPPYAIIPPWPGSTFSYIVGASVTDVAPASVQDPFFGITMNADVIAFVEYCRHLLIEAILEMRQIVEDKGLLYEDLRNPVPASPHDLNKAVTWSDIWTNYMVAVPQAPTGAATSDPSATEPPLQRMASDLARHLLHGARPTDTSNHTTAAAISTGQEIAVTVPTDGSGLNFRFTAGASNAAIRIANTDAVYHDGFMTAALSNPAYLTLKADDNIPTWIFHQRKYAWSKPAAADTVAVTLPGTNPLLTVVALPPAVVEEVEEDGGGSIVSLCISGSDTPLPNNGWQPAIVVRFPLTPSSLVGSTLASGMQLFSIAGATQGDRYFLDQLKLLPPADLNSPKRTGIALALETRGTDGTTARSPISEWTIARNNLTDQARPNSEGLVPLDMAQPAYPYPYVAGPGQQDDAIRLLEMNSITNSGGYYLRATTTAATATTLVLTVILDGVPSAASSPYPTQSALLPTAANCIAYKPDSSGQPITTFPDSVRFEGLKHVQVAPATPPGSALVGWTRDEPDPPASDADLFGYGTISLVAYSVSDGGGALLQSDNKMAAISASDALQGDPVGRADQGLVPSVDLHHTGTASAMRLRNGQAAASVGLAAGQLSLRYYRGRYTLPEAQTTPWMRLKDGSKRQLTFAPTLRDTFGNPFAPIAAETFKRTLFYTDALIGPGEWPGVRFAIYPTVVGVQPNLCLEMSYSFLAPNDDATSSFRDKTARLNQLSAIVIQLTGVDGEVTMTLNAAPLLKAAIQLDVKAICTQLNDWRDKESKNADPKATSLFAAPLQYPCDGVIGTIAYFDPQLQITRTNSAYGPQPGDLPTDPDLAKLITGQIMSVSSRVGLQLAATDVTMPKNSHDPQKDFSDIAQAFQTDVGPALSAQVAYLRDQLNVHELWLIPNSYFPTADKAAQWSYATPRPLSNTEGSDTFSAPNFAVNPTGTNLTVDDFTFTSVSITDQDLDELGRAAFRLIEQQTSDLTALTDAGNASTMSSLLSTREALADTLSVYAPAGPLPLGWIVPVFAAPGDLDAQAIQRTAKDALRQDLSAFYAISTVIQLPLKSAGNAAIRLFEGNVLSPFDSSVPKAKLPTFSDVLLGQTPNPQNPKGLQIPDQKVTVLYDLPSGVGEMEVPPVGSLTVSFTHVQLPPTSDQKLADGFNQGPWLRLAAPYSLNWNGPTETIPVVARQFPPQPTLLSTLPIAAWYTAPANGQPGRQNPLPVLLKDSDVSMLTAWGWQFTFGLLDPKSEDEVHVEVQYGSVQPEATAVPHSLVAAPWTPLSLLANLYVLKQLRDNWSTIEARTRLNVLDALTTSLAKFLGVFSSTSSPAGLTMPADGAPKSDTFDIEVSVAGTKPTTLRVMQTIMAPTAIPVSAGLGTAIVYALADGFNNTATLVGSSPLRSFKVVLTRTRNEQLYRNAPTTNAVLVYSCAPVQSPVDYHPLNEWGSETQPIAYDVAGRPLKDALIAFFKALFNKTDLSTMGVEIDVSLVWRKGSLDITTPFSILPSDFLLADKTFVGAAQYVLDVCSQLPNPALPAPPDVEKESSGVRLRIKITDQPPTAAGTQQTSPARTLLDIAAIDFILG